MLIESNTLRDIEKGYEAKYKLDEERRFKAECRRNKLFGLWIAGHLRLRDPRRDPRRTRRAQPRGYRDAGARARAR